MRYSPLQASGDGLQHVCRAEISEDLAQRLASLAAAVLPDAPRAVDPDLSETVAEEEAELGTAFLAYHRTNVFRGAT